MSCLWDGTNTNTKKLSTLKEIYAGGNRYRGKIPKFISSNLEIVSLPSNELSGDIHLPEISIYNSNNIKIGEELTFKHENVIKGYFEVRILGKLFDIKVFIK